METKSFFFFYDCLIVIACTWAIPLSSLFLLCPPGPEAEMGEVCVWPESPVQSRLASLFGLILPPLALGQRECIHKINLFVIIWNVIDSVKPNDKLEQIVHAAFQKFRLYTCSATSTLSTQETHILQHPSGKKQCKCDSDMSVETFTHR